MDPFATLLTHLHGQGVRFVVIGVWGANYYAHAGGVTFRTRDRDLFLPPAADNLLLAWRACETAGLELRSGKSLSTSRETTGSRNGSSNAGHLPRQPTASNCTST